MLMVAHVYPCRIVKYKPVLSLNFIPLCHLPAPLLHVCFALDLIDFNTVLATPHSAWAGLVYIIRHSRQGRDFQPPAEEQKKC